MNRVITVDGPAGSGKSTIAQRLAHVLLFKHLNSGLLYRGLTYAAIKYARFSPEDRSWPDGDDPFLDLYPRLSVKFGQDGGMTVLFDRESVNSQANSLEVSKLVPNLSKIASVRAFVRAMQHDIAKEFNVVADGRDCGFEVFPRAIVKIFLTATLDQRAKRVFERSKQQGVLTSLAETKESLALRDYADETRSIAPLRKAADAVVIDSTDMSIMDVLKKIICIAVPKL